MKYKVGDRVRVKSLDWYNENNINGDDILENIGIFPFFPYMAKFCGQVLTIKDIHITYYTMEETDYYTCWTDEMIEGLVEEDVDLIPKFGEFSDNEPLDIPTMTTDFIKEHGFPCPNGYIFKDENGNVINATKIVLEKKKKEYPKTYEECCEVLDIDAYDLVLSIDYRSNKMKHNDWKRIGKLNALNQILICRDAYWKIAGEEMGLGKPWEPDWNDGCYVIFTSEDGLIKRDTQFGINVILAFPSEEMRDAFYENFDSDIEICKELL